MAIAVQKDDDGWVIGDEVERSVRELMGSDRGEAVRKRSAEVRAAAAAAWHGLGGSSLAAFSNLVGSWSGHLIIDKDSKPE